jgi:hypothetical protein
VVDDDDDDDYDLILFLIWWWLCRRAKWIHSFIHSFFLSLSASSLQIFKKSDPVYYYCIVLYPIWSWSWLDLTTP